MRVLQAFEATFKTHSLQMTVMLRLSPVSTKMAQNYLLGATRVNYKNFILGTMIGIMP